MGTNHATGDNYKYIIVPGHGELKVNGSLAEFLGLEDVGLSSFLCFTLSTIVIVILVFILSVVLALFLMRCYNLYRSNYQVPSFFYSSPPSYETVEKTDRTELPSYQQAVQLQESHQKLCRLA